MSWLTRTAKRLDLPMGAGDIASAQRGARTVRLQEEADRLALRVEGGLPGGLAFHPLGDDAARALAREAGPFFQARDPLQQPGARRAEVEVLATGDPDFDEAVLTQGEERLVFSFLAATVRERLREALPALGASLVDGALRVVIDDEVEPPLPGMLELADFLAAAPCSDDVLRAAALSDPVPTFRARALEVLLEIEPAAEATRAACRSALDARDPLLRLVGAAALGEAGVDALVGIARDDEAPDPTRAEAIEALAGRAEPLADLWNVAAQRELPPEVLRPLVQALRPPAAEIQPRMDVDDDEVRAVYLEGLGLATPEPDTEEILIEHLGAKDYGVVHAAVGALARVGGGAAVEALRKLGKRPGVTDAISTIQARLERSPGALSMAPDQHGELSWAPGSGALSDAGERKNRR